MKDELVEKPLFYQAFLHRKSVSILYQLHMLFEMVCLYSNKHSQRINFERFYELFYRQGILSLILK